MGEFKLSIRSIRRMGGIESDLIRVVNRCIEITPIDFTVLEGMRTPNRQKALVSAGDSWTQKSRHLTGHAVDIAPLVNGRIPWKDLSKFVLLSTAMFEAADELGIVIQWGGDWDCDGEWRDEKRFDGPHYQIPHHYREKDAREAQEMRMMASRLSKINTLSCPGDAELV